MVQNRSLFVLLMLAAMTLPSARQAISAVSLAQAPEAPAPTSIDPFETEPPAESPAPTEASPAPLPPAFSLPESLPPDTTLTIDGSVSMAAINRTLIRRFEERFPGVTVVLEEQGSTAALQALLTGDGPDLAAIGRPLSDEESGQGLIEVPISREKIAIIIGDENPFQGDLTFDQFAQIFRGEIANWLYVGGPDLPIRFVDRPADSDTRRALSDYEIFQAVEFTTGDNAITLEVDDTAAVVEALGNDGISYAIASQVLDQDNVQPLSMDGTLPDDPRYPYSQPRGYAYTGTPTPAVEAFLAFATSADGQAALAEAKSAEAADVATAELPTSVAAMRPNGQGFVTGDREGNINFWNTDGSSAGAPEAAHTGPVTALAFSPDGNRIISGGADGNVRFWDAVGTPVGEPISAHGDPVSTLAIFPDGTFVSGSTDGSLRQWDTNGTPVGEPVAAHGDMVRAAAISDDGRTLVTAGNDGQVKLWNPDATAKGAFGGHDGPVTAVALKPDNTLVTGGEDSTVRLWDSSGAPLSSQPTAGPVTALAVSADGQRLATGDSNGTLQMRNGDGTPAGDPISDIGTPIDGLAFTPDGERLVVSAQDQPPQLRNQTGDLVSQAAPEGDPSETGNGNLAGLWQRLQSLGPRLWILLPILLLAILLWSLLHGVFGDEEDDEDEVEASSGDVTFSGAGTANVDLPSTSGDDIDWSAAADQGEVDFGATDFGETDFGQTDFGQADADATDFDPGDAPAINFGDEPAFAEPDVPDAIAAVPPATQGLDSRLAKARAALERGQALAQSGNLQDALDAANQAIESADVERLKALGAGVTVAGVGAIIARGMMRRGGILTALKRPEEALQSYDRALQLEPNDPDAWIGKGNLLLTQNRSDEALFCFDKAIEISPQSGSAWRGKGEALQQMDRTQDAQAALAHAETLGADDASVPMQSGIGAALGTGFAALGAAASRLRPDPVVDDAPEDDDLPSDLREALDYLPEAADTPDPNSPEASPVPTPEAEDMPWDAEEEIFTDEDTTVIQAEPGVSSPPAQDSVEEIIAFDMDDEEESLELAIETDDADDEANNDTVGFSLEQTDADVIDFDGGDADLEAIDLEGMDLDSIDDAATDNEDDTVEFSLTPDDVLPSNEGLDALLDTADSDDEGLDALLDTADEGNEGLDALLDAADAPVDIALEQRDLDDLGAVFDGETAPINLPADVNGDDLELSLSDDDEFEIALAPSDDQDSEDFDIDPPSDDQLIDFALDADLDVDASAIALEDDADPFSDLQSPAETTEDLLQEQVFDEDIPDELLTALEGISGFPPSEPVAQDPPAGSPPPPPPRRPAPPPLPSNPKLESE